MKTIVILKHDKVLNHLVLDCITCNDDQVANQLNHEVKSLLLAAKAGYIDRDFRIETVDKIRLTQMCF